MTCYPLMSVLAALALLGSCTGMDAGGVTKNPLPDQVSPPRASSSFVPSASYVLGEGDEIELYVWRQDTLKRTVKVDPCGNVTFPLVGEIKVAGCSLQETQAEVTKRLSRYFVDPRVDIRVISVVSLKAHLIGEVNNPGVFVLDHKTSPWELLAKGGFTKDANPGKVLLIRSNSPTAEHQPANRITVLNLDPNAMQGQPPQMAYADLQNGDIVYVPPRQMESGARFMTRVGAMLAPILGMQSAILLVPEIIDVISGTSAAGTQGGVIIGR